MMFVYGYFLIWGKFVEDLGKVFVSFVYFVMCFKGDGRRMNGWSDV